MSRIDLAFRGEEDPDRPRAARRTPGHRIVGASPAMAALRSAVEAVARTRSSVLVTGETGTGKGLVARQIHESSRERILVHVDCASLAPSVIESELFGHERGAFTGADELRVGRFERAGTGTVFLDEVAEIEPRLQAKLLRVLQDRVFERVGGCETLPFRARIVAATNRDLPSEIAAGRFRADLYYRLQVVELHVPPLRTRPEDVLLLARELARRLGCEPEFESGFEAALQARAWRGNVRELANLVERMSVTRREGTWRAADVASEPDLSNVMSTDPVVPALRERFEERERIALERVLVAERWNVSAAARVLGISRGALRGRMARLGLD